LKANPDISRGLAHKSSVEILEADRQPTIVLFAIVLLKK
jgi:hypothetical protein